MNWIDFQRVVLARIGQRLIDQRRVWESVDQFLVTYGFPPGDPVRSEVLAMLRQITVAQQTIADALERLPKPYRPGVDPWKISGLSARLKPDFRNMSREEIDARTKAIDEAKTDRKPSPKMPP